MQMYGLHVAGNNCEMSISVAPEPYAAMAQTSADKSHGERCFLLSIVYSIFCRDAMALRQRVRM